MEHLLKAAARHLLITDTEDNMRRIAEVVRRRQAPVPDGSETGFQPQACLQSIDCIHCQGGMDGQKFRRLAEEMINGSGAILMSSYRTAEMALQAMGAGACNAPSRPAGEGARQERLVLQTKPDESGRGGGFDAIVGENEEIRAIIRLCEKIAAYDTTVLITGESGTGKELIARGIHLHSLRRERPFFAINCGGIPENLLESELFGYRKGAFTGAHRNQKGIFEEADGSTLFLDEIGELPLPMQVKLLRVLQDGEIRPLGASGTRRINVRIVAATARNLARDVRQALFREDLFYRLNVVSVDLPPLRKRPDDIPLLCRYFIEKYRQILKRDVAGISAAAMDGLRRYPWPGNIRELENLIQRGMVLAEDSLIDIGQLPPGILGGKDPDSRPPVWGSFSLKEAQRQVERRMIQAALVEAGNNKSRAARLLEISYPSLLNKIKDYRLA